MQLFLIAAVVLAVALGMVYFMGKKQKVQQQSQTQTTSQQPQSPTSPQQPSSPSQGGQPQNPVS